MDFKSELASRYLRLVAIVALLLGLSDASRLLGVASGPASPITLLGPSGFAWLSVFCLSRLFSAVGLWIKASWGAVLLLSSTLLEMGLFLFGSGDVAISIPGFAVRLFLAISIVVLFGLSLKNRRAHD